MSNVQPLPKFKIDTTVLMLDKTCDTSDEPMDPSALQTIVVDRLYTAELGWLYRCAGVNGLMEETFLKAFDPSEVTHIADESGIYGCIVPESVKEAFQEIPFFPGDFAKTLEQLDSGELRLCYAVILGMYWDEDEWSFDVAMLEESGNFVDRGLWHYEEELERIDRETMESIWRDKRGEAAKPKLSLVHSR